MYTYRNQATTPGRPLAKKTTTTLPTPSTGYPVLPLKRGNYKDQVPILKNVSLVERLYCGICQFCLWHN